MTCIAGKYLYNVGFTYDASPVSDSNRTIDLSIYELFKLNVGAMKLGKTINYGIGATAIFIGDNDINQTARGYALPASSIPTSCCSSAQR